MRYPEGGHSQHDSDEVRSDLQWAIQNGRVIIIPLHVPVPKAAAGDETAALPAERPAAPPGQLF